MSDSAVPPTDPSPTHPFATDPSETDLSLAGDRTLTDGSVPDQGGGDPWTVRIPVKVLALLGTAVAAALVAVLVVAVVVNRGPTSPMEVVDDFVAAAEAGDLERFESHLCGELRRDWREMPAEVQRRNLGDMTQAILTMNWKAVGEEIHPDGDRATVTFTYTDEGGETIVDSFSLNREDGRWRVCG